MQDVNLEKAFAEFENQFKYEWKCYIALSKQLDKFRGMELGDNIGAVNVIIKEMNETFIRLYPSLGFILSYSEIAEAAVDDYLKFVEDLKTTNAVEYPINNNEQAKA